MRCYLCGSRQDPEIEQCEVCDTRLVAPASLSVPSAFHVFNATEASGGSPTHIVNQLVAAAADVELLDEVSQSTDHPEEAESDEAEFDFEALFTSTTSQTESDEPAETVEDASETETQDDSRRVFSASRGPSSEALRVAGIAIAVAVVLVLVGIQANRRAPAPEFPLAFGDQPGFPTTAERSVEELAQMLEPVVFSLPKNECTTSRPLAVAVGRDRLITAGSLVEPGQVITITAGGEKITGSVIGGTRRPDLAVIRLDERLDIEDLEIPPIAGPLELDAAESLIVDDGRLRETPSGDLRAGWAGTHHGVEIEDESITNGLAFLPSGRLVGLITDGGDRTSVAVTGAALRDGLDRIARGEGDIFGCRAERSAAARASYPSADFGLDHVAPGSDPVLEPISAACAGRDWQSCDDLLTVSVPLSEYSRSAEQCGGHRAQSTGGASCVEELRILGPPPEVEPVRGTCLALPRAQGSEAVIVDCFDPHDAEVYATAAEPADCRDMAVDAATDLYWDRPTVGDAIDVARTDLGACFVFEPGFDLVGPLPD